ILAGDVVAAGSGQVQRVAQSRPEHVDSIAVVRDGEAVSIAVPAVGLRRQNAAGADEIAIDAGCHLTGLGADVLTTDILNDGTGAVLYKYATTVSWVCDRAVEVDERVLDNRRDRGTDIDIAAIRN